MCSLLHTRSHLKCLRWVSLALLRPSSSHFTGTVRALVSLLQFILGLYVSHFTLTIFFFVWAKLIFCCSFYSFNGSDVALTIEMALACFPPNTGRIRVNFNKKLLLTWTQHKSHHVLSEDWKIVSTWIAPFVWQKVKGGKTKKVLLYWFFARTHTHTSEWRTQKLIMKHFN